MRKPKPILKCDSAVVFADAVMTNKAIEFQANDEYKYLTAFQVFDGGGYSAVASKDMKEWVLCIGAFIEGEKIDGMQIVRVITDLESNISEGE